MISLLTNFTYYATYYTIKYTSVPIYFIKLSFDVLYNYYNIKMIEDKKDDKSTINELKTLKKRIEELEKKIEIYNEK